MARYRLIYPATIEAIVEADDADQAMEYAALDVKAKLEGELRRREVWMDSSETVSVRVRFDEGIPMVSEEPA